LITGETALTPVGVGSALHAGALNLTGRLVIAVTARSEDSTLAAIARLMEAGAQSRSAYVRLADKAAALYVPIVHMAALPSPSSAVGRLALGRARPCCGPLPF
jgi:Cu2+-exporting ATPase